MAILQNRMSTVAVPHYFGTPDDRRYYPLACWERGPIAIEDTSEGLQYQDWKLTWNSATGELLAFPETTEVVEVVATLADLENITFTFDQAGRISFTYKTSVSTFLYWYDSSLGTTVTTDLGSDVVSASLALDDKRTTQMNANDMILWYTKFDDPTYTLYSAIQRERFLIETSMGTGLDRGYIQNLGMNRGLRGQIAIEAAPGYMPPFIPTPIPIPPATSENLSFESASVGWFLTGDFAINQVDPRAGNYGAQLVATDPATYSMMRNNFFFNVTPLDTWLLLGFARSVPNTFFGLGLQYYDGGYNVIHTSMGGHNTTAAWQQFLTIETVPVGAVFARLIVDSNGSTGTVSFDDFIREIL